MSGAINRTTDTALESHSRLFPERSYFGDRLERPAETHPFLRQVRKAVLATSVLLALAPTRGAAQEVAGTPAFRVPMGSAPSVPTLAPTYAWLEQVGTCSTTCGSGTRVMSHQCQNVADYDYGGPGYGLPEADAMCSSSAGPKPTNASEACTVYSGCGYDWVKPPVVQTPLGWNGNPVGRVGCGYVNSRFEPYCQRTGGGINVVLASSDHRFCAGDLPDYADVAAGTQDALGFDRSATQEGTCDLRDHDWTSSGYGSWSSDCSTTATRSRVVTCTRRWNGTVQADAECDAASRPSSSEAQARYSSCAYTASAPGAWGPWASGCSSSTTRQRRSQCRRSNDGGQTVPDVECTSRGVTLEETQTDANYAACTYSWTTGEWGSWSSACSATASRTRTVQCTRDLDGAPGVDADCTAARPSASETNGQYGSCSYSRGAENGVSGWSSGCSASAQRTRSFECKRSDGTVVGADECTSRHVSLSDVETAGVYSGCTYRIEDAGVGACRSDNTAPHYWRCVRDQTGEQVDSAAHCGRSNPTADPCTYYSYELQDAGVGACKTDNTAPHYWRCIRRPDNVEMDSSTYCGRANPTAEQCTYKWAYTAGYGDWSACSGGSQSRAMTSCTREDGAAAPISLCNAAGYASTMSQSCTSPVFTWASFKGYCKNVLGQVSISDDRESLPDLLTFKQSCAERGGTCYMHQMSEQHDYDGRRESYNESYVCGSNPVYDPTAVGSYSNANSSGFVYTEVRE